MNAVVKEVDLEFSMFEMLKNIFKYNGFQILERKYCKLLLLSGSFGWWVGSALKAWTVILKGSI